MSCEACKGHTDLTEETKAVKRASEITQVYDRQNHRLWIVIIIMAASMIVMAGAMVWQSVNQQRIVAEAIQQSQEVMNEAVLQALYTVSEIESSTETVTSTQTVEGDSATINNVEGEQYNDSATNQGGGS